MAFTIKLTTNEEAYALREAMLDLANEQGRVTEGDIFKMLNLEVAGNEKDKDMYWALGKLNQIQIRAVENGGWCVMLPQPNVPENDKDIHPCDTTVEKTNMSPDELELRVRITDAINGKFSETTVVTIEYIGKRLQAAYSRGLKYDVSDLREHVMELAKNSPHHRDRCCKAVEQMHFKSDGILVNIHDWKPERIEDNDRLKELVSREWNKTDLDELIAHELRNYPDRIKDMVEACAALKSGEFHAAKKALGPDYDFCFDNEDFFVELQRALKRQLNALPARVLVAYSKPGPNANYESEDNMVSHPQHYQSSNGIEVIDVIKAFTEGLTGIVATDAGNIIKYACRWHKKNGIQDLEKILWYTQHLINELKEAENNE